MLYGWTLFHKCMVYMVITYTDEKMMGISRRQKRKGIYDTLEKTVDLLRLAFAG